MEHRICNFCQEKNKTVIEDEYHVLLCCEKYTTLRSRYLDIAFWDPPTFQKFIVLMSCTEIEVMRTLATFVYKIEQMRSF
jgi:hypothetical protein